jgi:hypothetical protein
VPLRRRRRVLYDNLKPVEVIISRSQSPSSPVAPFFRQDMKLEQQSIQNKWPVELRFSVPGFEFENVGGSASFGDLWVPFEH